MNARFFRLRHAFAALIALGLILVSMKALNTYSTDGKPADMTVRKPERVHGVHLTSWMAGSKAYRSRLEPHLDKKLVNTVVIAVKEYNGEVYIPGVQMAQEFGAYKAAMPDIENYLRYLKFREIYTVGRIVVFKDSVAAAHKPEWAVKDAAGRVWRDFKGYAWLDPYTRAGWEYTFQIAEQCARLGFDEIQFDYVRFPSDGIIKNCRYSAHHSSTTAVNVLAGFLREAGLRLKPKYNVNISVDVFGLTTTNDEDMGIGQNIVPMAQEVDYICPMVYPSHYPKGTYGISNPNTQPYRTIDVSLESAVRRLGANAVKLRPYLQDFSLGYHYGAGEIEAQMRALYANGVYEWTLWNPKAVYTYEVFKSSTAWAHVSPAPRPPDDAAVVPSTK